MATALDKPEHALQDFLFFRHFSYGCKQVFSGDRWALTGEAGLFLDPFYSPGTDFIAIANTYICELVGRDRAQRVDQAAAGEAERVLDVRQRDVHDGGVEHHHELRGGDDDKGQAETALSGRLGTCGQVVHEDGEEHVVDAGVKDGQAAGRSLQGPGDVSAVGILGEVAAGSGPQRVQSALCKGTSRPQPGQ